jgi:hypothetical protein
MRMQASWSVDGCCFALLLMVLVGSCSVVVGCKLQLWMPHLGAPAHIDSTLALSFCLPVLVRSSSVLHLNPIWRPLFHPLKPHPQKPQVS